MLRAIEFYSGIGGLHCALEETGLGKVCAAFEWDPNAAAVYTLNHGKDIVHRRDIGTLAVEDLEPLQADLWLASPACQPYTVLGLQKQDADPRAKSFLHLMQDVLPALVERGTHPTYILVENVAGFETSTTRTSINRLLHELGYHTTEFLLTPRQYGIPNSRLRYYLMARLIPFTVSPDLGILRCLPGDNTHYIPSTISDYLDKNIDPHTAISDRVLARWGRLFDIVYPSSTNSCCFTRGYSHLVEGSGSILQLNDALETSSVFDVYFSQQEKGEADAVQTLHQLQLRYFSPEELLRLFHLSTPSRKFLWPEHVSRKTNYRLIGNSVNVAVVGRLITFLCT